MKTKDFYFDLPDNLIAREPSAKRGDSRLLVIDPETRTASHSTVERLPEFLDRDTLLVLNDSRVRKSRLYGYSDSGGKTEFLFLEKKDPYHWKAMANKAKKQRVGKEFLFPGSVTGKISAFEQEFRILEFSVPLDDPYFERYGRIPLPPYIKRQAGHQDEERYQTVYSKQTGSAAAPTAGLHFTQTLLRKMENNGVKLVYVTLHVGPGTFLPIRAENIEDHIMHHEEYEISEQAAARITKAKQAGKKILGLGTTAVRTLESSWDGKKIRSGKGSTNLFIFPGYRFQVVDQMITNFHTPGSSLLLLVAAFAGKEFLMDAYHEALKRNYRFYSYGDAMFIKSKAD